MTRVFSARSLPLRKPYRARAVRARRQSVHARKNNGEHSLHGGIKGFNRPCGPPKYSAKTASRLELSYLSKDGEEGFPGNLKVSVIYHADDSNALADLLFRDHRQKNVVNLTNHLFHLAGQGSEIFSPADIRPTSSLPSMPA